MVSPAVARVQLDRTLEIFFCSRPIPIKTKSNSSQSCVAISKRLIKVDRAHRRRLCFWIRIHRSDRVIHAEQHKRIGEPGVRERVIGRQFDGSLVLDQALLQIVRPALVPEVASPKIGIVSLSVRLVSRPLGPFCGKQLERERSRYAGRDFALHRQRVSLRPLVALRPEMCLIVDLYQLGSYSQPIGVTSDAAFKHVADVQLRAYPANVLVAALIGHCRSAGDHAQSRWLQASELGDHFFRHPVAEIVLFGIVA